MNLKLDLENYRARQASDPGRAGRPAGLGFAVNGKIVRAVGLALLVWALIAAVLLSI